MTEKMFNSPELAKLYKKGQLDELLDTFKHKINKKTLIGGGGDASVFRCDDDKFVLKLCTKQIRYFKHYSKKGHANKFMLHINQLDPFFVPVEEILYEDKNVFIYKQRKCQIVTPKDINKQIVIDVFRLIQFMLINNILLTDLAPHNLGLINGHVKVFDYHGLHPLKRKGEIRRPKWWKRIARNLTRVLCALCVPNKRKEYANLMQNCNQSAIKKISRDTLIPQSFIQLLSYLESKRNKISINKTLDLLEDCITQIKSIQGKNCNVNAKKKKYSDSSNSSNSNDSSNSSDSISEKSSKSIPSQDSYRPNFNDSYES